MEILERLWGFISTDADRDKQFNMLEFGACDGYHTGKFLEMLRVSKRPYRLDSFEPEKSNFKTCEHAVSGLRPHLTDNEHVFSLWPYAVGAKTEIRPFYVSGGEKRVGGRVIDRYYGSSSIRAPKMVTEAWPDMTFHQDTVQVYALDDMHMLPRRIDFIWADIQGAAGDLVEGGPETFKHVKYLYVEYDNSELYEGEVLGVNALAALLPDFDVVEDYGGDVLLQNRST